MPVTIQYPINQLDLNLANGDTIDMVKWEPQERPFSRDAVLYGSYALMAMFGRAGLLVFQDRNPHLIPVIQDMVDTFGLFTTFPPDQIYYWEEWNLADPERGTSEIERQDAIAELPWSLQLSLPLEERHS